VKPRGLNPARPGVYVTGQVRQRKKHWVVTLFLVNGQEPSRPKDEAFVFQPKLSVQAADGTAAFVKRVEPRASGNGDPATWLEEQRLAMLYRRHVEFVVGHGVSVHADTASGDRPAD
jgi:hypothetical protein